MKVLLISGSYPPEVCGVGDYTAQLAEALTAAGLSVTTLHNMSWKLRHMRKTAATIRRSGCDIIHLQYPSEGYGWSIVPQLLCLRFPIIITLHEFFHSRLPRRIACVPFFLFAKHLVLTTKQVQDGIARLFPWTRSKSSVIPIGTNIPPSAVSSARKLDEILYFGLVAPRKGVEEVLELARLAQKDGSKICVHIVGAIMPRLRHYAEQQMDAAKNQPVRWTLDQPPQLVANILASAAVAYLPFPDGASERRGSLKAALSLGVTCVTTEGPATPDEMRSAVVFSTSVEDAYRKAKSLLGNREECGAISAQATRYAQTFSWDSIAKLHEKLYFSEIGFKPMV